MEIKRRKQAKEEGVYSLNVGVFPALSTDSHMHTIEHNGICIAVVFNLFTSRIQKLLN